MQNQSNNIITNVLKVTLLLILVAWCFLIMQPFILIVLWAIILGVALFPPYSYLVKKIGASKKKLVTIIFGLVVTTLLMVPAYFITSSVANTTMETVSNIKNNSFEIPAPNENVKEWPLIGDKLYSNWTEASKDIKHYSIVHKDFILDQGSNLLSGFKGFIGAFVTFFFAFIIALVFMYHSEYTNKAALKLFNKLIGNDSDEIINMSRDVIRSVVKGILLVALIQSGLAFIGFKVIGLPAAGVFAFIILVTSIVQIPAILTMIPAIILAFSIADTTPAIIFTIYCVLVGISDNILKPMLLGKGLHTPMIIILIGTIGGMLLHGIIGLFLGAIVLAVMYRMYEYWVNSSEKKINI
ncbi:MAG: AI-2E family transporter [Psychroserpens sp.]|uniref:AI-2E family transporter n=1 Tax=Psychroserpens sp. TaxID=2020870 RepID=UPI0030016C1D